MAVIALAVRKNAAIVSTVALLKRRKGPRRKMAQVNPKIREYIEAEILPQYKRLAGHTEDHIETVIRRSLEFAKQAPNVNIDMVYVIAAYHDLGRLIDNETHSVESAKMLRGDKFLREYFDDSEIETMAEAVEDHRASLGHEPRSVYGKIVSSADRNPNIESMLAGCYAYKRMLHPDASDDEVIEMARKHIQKKYSPDGYAAKTMYFKDPGFEQMLVEVEEITKDFETFARVQRKYNQEHTGNCSFCGEFSS